MHWQKLIEASDLFRTHVPDATKPHDDLMKQWKDAQWESDTGPSADQVAEMLRFLNRLATRYPSDEGSRASFKKAYVKVLPLLRLLEGYDLIEAQFDSRVAGAETLSETIQEVFGTLARAVKKPQWTGASKILHVLQPRLFVMWDSAIRSGYAVKEGSESSEYGYWFLPLMQREAREAVDSYAAETKSERRVAVQELEKRAGGRPITKLLDEYNYCKFTLRCRKLWE
jgi:hypothetical protein